MFGFEFEKNFFIGIDAGTSAIKMVELKVSGGKTVLSNYAWMPVEDSFISDAGYGSENLTEYFKRIISEAGFRGKNAYVSLPAFGGLITLLDLPGISSEDLSQAIEFEVHKYIPTSLDEVTLSWDIIGEKNKTEESKGEKTTRVLLAVASKGKVETCKKVIRNSGLNLKAIEIESFSLVNSLIGNDSGRFIIVDIGHRFCNVILVENGLIIVNRNLDAGGKDITRTIAKSMNINEERAEKLKISNKDFFSNESYINFPALEMIGGEIVRMMKTYSQKEGSAGVESIVLSGGTSSLLGIDKYFKNALGVNVVRGNPLRRINYDERLETAIEKIKPRFSVCVGLALKGAHDYLNKK